ncbi:hypothetical protein OUZ56_003820 [Daphnia magna]|uniref:Uncharacterized protein n=1 Tax=Daphnia magna TaxID=35525 RepID=A0ABQ9YMW5_9CRUS|nr:hypothetical protein OUZ56_003820 [Daphnia magna]
MSVRPWTGKRALKGREQARKGDAEGVVIVFFVDLLICRKCLITLASCLETGLVKTPSSLSAGATRSSKMRYTQPNNNNNHKPEARIGQNEKEKKQFNNQNWKERKTKNLVQTARNSFNLNDFSNFTTLVAPSPLYDSDSPPTPQKIKRDDGKPERFSRCTRRHLLLSCIVYSGWRLVVLARTARRERDSSPAAGILHA